MSRRFYLGRGQRAQPTQRDRARLTVNPSTNMHTGTAGPTIVLADLRPGDEVVVVLAVEPPPTTTGSPTGGAPSALPRQAASGPSDVSELMAFRAPQSP